MAQEFSQDELSELLKPESLEGRGNVPDERIEEVVGEHLKRVDEEISLLRRLVGLYALKVADRYNRNRIDYLNDEANATHVLPYVRLHETSHHVEMVWGKVKNWTEDETRKYAKRVKQKQTRDGRRTLNSTVVELKKYRLDNGDFSLKMFEKEPMWVQVIGKDVEMTLRTLRQTRALLTEILRKKRSVRIGLEKLSEGFKPKDGEGEDEDD